MQRHSPVDNVSGAGQSYSRRYKDIKGITVQSAGYEEMKLKEKDSYSFLGNRWESTKLVRPKALINLFLLCLASSTISLGMALWGISSSIISPILGNQLCMMSSHTLKMKLYLAGVLHLPP